MFYLEDEEKEEEVTSTEETVEVEATPVEEANTTTSSDSEGKSKMVAGLLGIFLGTFGVHNFYLGYTGKAVAQLLISLLSCGTLAIVSEVWGLVEGIMILMGNINTDANGNPLKD